MGADEKNITVDLYSTDSEQSTQTPIVDWTPKEEKWAVLKIDLTVLPLLTIGLAVFQFDRMNLASALTGGFKESVHIDQNTVNLGNQLLFLGIFLLEIPFNILLMKFGPRKWLPIQVFLFGFIAIMQVFIKNRSGFLATRFILGIAEAGYIPGGCYIISTWYKKSERASRTSIYFFGMFGGYAVSPLICSAILLLSGRQGLAGWQWIFLLEGVLTLVIAILLLLLLPSSPGNPRPLFFKGLIPFNDKDAYILHNRLLMEDAKNADQREPITFIHIRQVLLNWRRWPHFLSTAIVFGTWSPITTYTPTIIMNLGFNRVQANALASIGGFLAVFVVFMFGIVSDKTNRRGISVMVAITLYLIVLIVCRQIQLHVGKWSKFGVWTLVNAFAVGYHPIQNTWLQLNCKSPQERSIAIAMWVMSAMVGLICGSQIFRTKDAPHYNTGLLVMILMVAVGLILAGLQYAIYYWQNQKLAKNASLEKNEGDDLDEFVYVL